MKLHEKLRKNSMLKLLKAQMACMFKIETNIFKARMCSNPQKIGKINDKSDRKSVV